MKGTPQPDPSVPFDDALELASAGRHADAVMRALEIAGESPEESRAATAAQVLARIARLAEAAGDLASSDRALEHAIILRPRYADLHFQYGALLAQRGRRAEARRELDAALDIHPRYLAARVELAMLDAREGRIGEALAELRNVQRDRGIAEPHTFLQGLQSLERADWDAADAQFRRAVQGSHPRLDRQLERYRELMSEGNPERAAEVLREAVERHESYPDLHALLGACELGLGHFDDALCSFARALELNPNFHAARVQMALTLDALGDRSGASEQLALVLQAEPGQPQAMELSERWQPRARSGGDSHGRKRA
ncbi:MAG: tetratricopeptide repeat protein [Candidatus Eiseniibacteriota bacterium]